MKEVMVREYKVINAMMGPDFHMSAAGAQMIAQECFAALMASHHVAAYDLRRRGLMWIIAEFSMRFEGVMPFWGDPVTVELWLSEKPSVKVCTDYVIRYGERTVCRGCGIWAILDINSRKPVVASEVISDIECNQELVLGTHHFRIPKSADAVDVACYQTNAGDTDFNNHICNISYLKAAVSAFSQEYRDTHALSFVNLKFRHEEFLGQKLTCTLFGTQREDDWTVSITNDEGRVCCDALFAFGPAVQDACHPFNSDLKQFCR